MKVIYFALFVTRLPHKPETCCLTSPSSLFSVVFSCVDTSNSAFTSESCTASLSEVLLPSSNCDCCNNENATTCPKPAGNKCLLRSWSDIISRLKTILCSQWAKSQSDWLGHLREHTFAYQVAKAVGLPNKEICSIH